MRRQVSLPGLRWVLLGIMLGCSGSTGPNPNALYLVIQNATPDSGFIVLKTDSGGPVLRQQRLQPHDSVCWMWVLRDSVYFNAGIWVRGVLYHPFGRLGGEGGLTWTTQVFRITHVNRVVIEPSNPPVGDISGLINLPPPC